MQKIHIPLQKRLTRQSFQDALQIFQESSYNPNSPKSEVITDIIKDCEYFRSIFSSPVKLGEFAQLARFYANYEVFDYGSVAQPEGEPVEKIYMLLEGNIEEFQRKRESEFQDERRCKTFQGEKTEGIRLEIRKKSQSFPLGFEGDKSPFMTEISLISKTDIQEHQDKYSQALKFGLVTRRKVMPLTLPSIFEEDIFRRKVETTRTMTKIKTEMISLDREALLQTARTCDESEDVYSLLSMGGSMHNLKMSPDDEKLLEIVALNDPKMKEDFVKVKALHYGDSFGAEICQAKPINSDSMFIVSSEKAHFLTLSIQSYSKISKQLEKQQNDKIELLINIFPSFEQKDIKRFSEFFAQKSFSKDEVIYSQYEASQHIYLIHSGEVRLSKGYSSSNDGATSPLSISSQKAAHEILLASLVKGQFFGEEKLIEKEQRIYTAISNSHGTVAWVLEAAVYEQIKLKFGSFFGALKEQAQEKLIWRAQRAVALFQAQNKPLKLKISHQAANSQLPPIHVKTPRETKAKLDQETSSHFERLKSYKANFSRKAVLSNNLESPNAKFSRPASLKSLDISPIKDLVGFNLRKDLYNFDENEVQYPLLATTEREIPEVVKPKLRVRFLGEKLLQKQRKREEKDQRLMKAFAFSKGGSKIVKIGGHSQQ